MSISQAELRQKLIDWVLAMKNGNEKCTPQPDYAREALKHYHAELPWLNLMAGVKDALK